VVVRGHREGLQPAQRSGMGEGGSGHGWPHFPWGNEWDVTRFNSRESDIGKITSVHAFPQGASPYSVLDMAGNVQEWTPTQWGFAYFYRATDGRENI
jgi:formylglycine-generating enzyme required for sulfatase activity